MAWTIASALELTHLGSLPRLWVLLPLPAKIAAATTAGTALACIVLLLAILVLHWKTTRTTLRIEALNKMWMRWLLSFDSWTGGLPVEDRDLAPFMKSWLHLLESLRGDFRDRLIEALNGTSIPKRITARMEKVGVAERILSMETLGSLRDRSCVEQLRPLVTIADSIVSLHAATALLSIDPRGLLAELLPHLLWRDDWPLSRIHSHLRDAPADLVQEQLLGFIRATGSTCPPRALRLLDLLPHESRTRVIRELLEAIDPVPAASESILLSAIQDPSQADLVRDRIRHPRWTVLLPAVRALGRVGNPDDIPALVDLLAHPQWWVRYRAAGAIASLPQLKPIQVEMIAAGQADPLAQEMLRFALTERSLA